MATALEVRFRQGAAERALVKFLLSYESDTFSASGSGITERQAERIAKRMIRDMMHNLDGVGISAYLDEVRGR